MKRTICIDKKMIKDVFDLDTGVVYRYINEKSVKTNLAYCVMLNHYKDWDYENDSKIDKIKSEMTETNLCYTWGNRYSIFKDGRLLFGND